MIVFKTRRKSCLAVTMRGRPAGRPYQQICLHAAQKDLGSENPFFYDLNCLNGLNRLNRFE